MNKKDLLKLLDNVQESGEETVEGERYLICDDKGAIGSPIKDSLRTCVSEDTTEAVLLIYAPGYLSDDQLLKDMEIFIKRVQTYCGGRLIDQYLQSNEIREF